MEEMSRMIRNASDGETEDFKQLAVRWSEYCLKNHYGTLLLAGLRISQALVEYQRVRYEPGLCKTLKY